MPFHAPRRIAVPAGALLAVPITAMLQVVAARIDRLHPLAVLLGR